MMYCTAEYKKMKKKIFFGKKIAQVWAATLKSTATLLTFFSFCMMFGMQFSNVSVFLNSVVAAYVHLATSSMLICVFTFNTLF